MFTAEELAEMQRADAEIDKEFENNPESAIRHTRYLKYRKRKLDYAHNYYIAHKTQKAEYDRLRRQKEKAIDRTGIRTTANAKKYHVALIIEGEKGIVNA